MVRKRLMTRRVFLCRKRGFLAFFRFFRRLKNSTAKNQAVKGVQRGIFPLCLSNDPRPPYGSMSARPFGVIGICRRTSVHSQATAQAMDGNGTDVASIADDSTVIDAMSGFRSAPDGAPMARHGNAGSWSKRWIRMEGCQWWRSRGITESRRPHGCIHFTKERPQPISWRSADISVAPMSVLGQDIRCSSEGMCMQPREQ